MPDENEQNALTKIKAYLDADHSLDAIRQIGWASWIDHLEAKGYDLRTGQLAIAPPEARTLHGRKSTFSEQREIDVGVASTAIAAKEQVRPAAEATLASHKVASYSSEEGGGWTSIRRTAWFWLRWISVLPAGAIGVIVVSFPIHWIVLFFTSSVDNTEGSGLSLWNLPPESLERMGQAFFAPVVFLFITTKVAPALKLQVGGVLAVLYAMALGGVLVYGGTSGFYEDWGWVEFGAVGVLGGLGVLTGSYWSYERITEQS